MAVQLFSYESGPSTPLPTQPTNTVAVTSLPKSFFHREILSILRTHFESFGDINQWVPLQGFGRIIIVFESEHHAELVKQKCDPILVQARDGLRAELRVYRADPNPLIPQGERTWIPTTSYLRPPPIEKNFLISPPGSPPVGWEPIKEDPPNASPLAEDLIQALQRLRAFDDKPSFEQILDPLEGSGVGVYVEDCDARTTMELDDDDWVYGETAPARQKWRSFATAMPPIN